MQTIALAGAKPVVLVVVAEAVPADVTVLALDALDALVAVADVIEDARLRAKNQANIHVLRRVQQIAGVGVMDRVAIQATQMDDPCIKVAKFANNLRKKSIRDVDCKELHDVVVNEHSESFCIVICNVLFTYYSSQHDICTSDTESQLVKKSFLSMYKSIFEDIYIDASVINTLFDLRVSHANMDKYLSVITMLYKNDCIRQFPISCVYLYRNFVNYIVDRSMFCVEPYATAIDEMLTYLSENKYVDGKSPNYLN